MEKKPVKSPRATKKNMAIMVQKVEMEKVGQVLKHQNYSYLQSLILFVLRCYWTYQTLLSEYHTMCKEFKERIAFLQQENEQLRSLLNSRSSHPNELLASLGDSQENEHYLVNLPEKEKLLVCMDQNSTKQQQEQEPEATKRNWNEPVEDLRNTNGQAEVTPTDTNKSAGLLPEDSPVSRESEETASDRKVQVRTEELGQQQQQKKRDEEMVAPLVVAEDGHSSAGPNELNSSSSSSSRSKGGSQIRGSRKGSSIFRKDRVKDGSQEMNNNEDKKDQKKNKKKEKKEKASPRGTKGKKREKEEDGTSSKRTTTTIEKDSEKERKEKNSKLLFEQEENGNGSALERRAGKESGSAIKERKDKKKGKEKGAGGEAEEDHLARSTLGETKRKEKGEDDRGAATTTDNSKKDRESSSGGGGGSHKDKVKSYKDKDSIKSKRGSGIRDERRKATSKKDGIIISSREARLRKRRSLPAGAETGQQGAAGNTSTQAQRLRAMQEQLTRETDALLEEHSSLLTENRELAANNARLREENASLREQLLLLAQRQEENDHQSK